MTYKWIGAVMVLLSCGGLGFSMAARYKQEEGRLRQLLRGLAYMQTYLAYRLTPLPELCRQTGSVTSGVIRQVFSNLARELEAKSSPEVIGCIRLAIRKSGELSPSLRKLLVQLGQTLGRFDLEGQLKGIQAVEQTCMQQLRLLEENRDMQMRSYRTLGICAGAALIILFV